MNIYYQPDDYAVRARELLEDCEYLQAKHLLQELLEQEPDHADGHFLLGILFAEDLNDLQSGLYHLKLAVRYDGKHVYALFNYILLLIYVGAYEEAIVQTDKAFKLGVDRHLVMEQKGKALELSGKLGDAIDCYEKAVMFSTDHDHIEACEAHIHRVCRKLKRSVSRQVSVRYVINTA